MSKHRGAEQFDPYTPQESAVAGPVVEPGPNDPPPAPAEPDVPENILSLLKEAHAAAVATSEAVKSEQVARAAVANVDEAKTKQKDVLKRIHEAVDTAYGVS